MRFNPVLMVKYIFAALFNSKTVTARQRISQAALHRQPDLNLATKVRETVKLPEEGHRQASRAWEQGKKAKPKAMLDRTGSEQRRELNLEHERVKKLTISNRIMVRRQIAQRALEQSRNIMIIQLYLSIQFSTLVKFKGVLQNLIIKDNYQISSLFFDT
ncbi:Hypothetical_protein [Hexamita inflata]|uniref:Hypothetical_protein n=1 Tax=Hexamita inflata TaxID=28002 RepID=A0ABP1GYU6_9EUKA